MSFNHHAKITSDRGNPKKPPEAKGSFSGLEEATVPGNIVGASERRAVSTAHRAILAAVAICLMTGCSWTPWRKVPLDAATGFYQSASLTYRLDAGKLQQPLDVARVEGPSVSYDQVASSPLADQSIGTLSIAYPHPEGRAGLAEVKFTLDSTRAKPTTSKNRNPFSKKPPHEEPALVTAQPEVHEVWLLDIPSGESDQYFKLLSNQNFFNTDRPGAVGAQLTAKINGKEVRKDWEQLGELNALVQRVRREGQLVSYTRPTMPQGAAASRISSTEAYRDLLARSGAAEAGGEAASPTANAFSMRTTSGGPTTVARLPSAIR